MSLEVDVKPAEPMNLTQPVQDLVEFLRDSQNEDADPEEAANQFGVPANLVRDVQSCLRLPMPYESPTEGFVRGLSQAMRQLGDGLKSFWLKISSRPIPFVLITTLIFLVLVVLIDRGSQAPAGRTPVVRVNHGLGELVSLLLALHMLCYGRHGKARFPLFGTFLAFGCVTGASLLVAGATLATGQSRVGPIFQSVLVGLVLSIPYATLGMAASVVGGYFRTRGEMRSELRLSRQELLDRLFEIEGRLRRPSEGKSLLTPLERFIRECRTSRFYPGFAAAAGFTIGVCQVLVTLAMGTLSRGSSLLFTDLIDAALLLAEVAGFLFIGYVAGTVRRSISGLFLAGFCFMLPSLIPIAPYGVHTFFLAVLSPNFLLVGVLLATVGLFTGLGAEMEARALLNQRLDENDLPVLLAELIRIQRRLGRVSQSACVMVVDVARSTMMKSDRDQLRIEWSFRSFQELVAEISTRNGGQVISTAGDGAVVSFPGSQEALDSAREIQTEMPRFNARKNRLSLPFRVRIGLHTGETQTQISDAPFNEIIDIAAHIEAIAPINGIAVSGPVAARLREEDLAAMKDEVDGQPVFIVLNPTIGA